MPGRKHKNYKKPKRPFDKVRINNENILIKKYGLKNKKEIWKAESAISEYRNQAKLLLTKSDEAQQEFIERLKKKGFNVESIAEVLALDTEDYLKRRLQSILFTKKIANTPKQSRQFITHKHVAIEGKLINRPSYMVQIDQENNIELMLVRKDPNNKKSQEDKKVAEELLEEQKKQEEAKEESEPQGEQQNE